MDWVNDRIGRSKQILEQLIQAPKLRFDETLRCNLPELHGIYTISSKDAPEGAFLRAGRTKTAAGGLRQRIYQNHFMGDQKGNLRRQLVREGRCSNLEQTKEWIRENCVVQFVVIDEDDERQWAEHFILAILHPSYCD